MKHEIKNVIFGIIAFMGFICIVGTAGASDANILSDMQFILQAIVGILLLVFGVFGLNFEDKHHHKNGRHNNGSRKNIRK